MNYSNATTIIMFRINYKFVIYPKMGQLIMNMAHKTFTLF